MYFLNRSLIQPALSHVASLIGGSAQVDSSQRFGVIKINLLNIQNLWSLCILDSAIAGPKPG